MTAMSHTVSLPVSDLDPGEMYVLLRDSIVPRAVAWVSTVSDTGATNLAPFSFFTICSPCPPVLGFSCGPRGDNHNAPVRVEKDTERNVRASGEFVVNLSPEKLMDAVIKSSDVLPPGESEFAHTGARSRIRDRLGSRAIAADICGTGRRDTHAADRCSHLGDLRA